MAIERNHPSYTTVLCILLLAGCVTAQSLDPCGAGTVSDGAGGTLDVFTINGSSGGPQRRVDILQGQPVTIAMAAPPGSAGGFALFGRFGVPSALEATPIPGVGTFCFTPCPLNPQAGNLFTVVNNLVTAPCPPLLAAPPAPWSQTFPGLPAGNTFTLQGAIETSPGVFAVTNGIILNFVAPTTPALLQSYANGFTTTLFDSAGPPLPFCPFGVPLNSDIAFVFNGPFDPAQLPPAGPASVGSIQITNNFGIPASGTWSVDPLNPNIVRFDPVLPGDPNNPCLAGLQPSSTYTVFVTTSVTLAGMPLSQGAAFCFTTDNCSAANPTAAFIDEVPGPPVVTASAPANGATVTVSSITTNGQSTVSIDVNEALAPGSVSNLALTLVDITNPSVGIPILGSVSFMQVGTVPGNSSVSRLVMTTSTPLPDAHTFRISSAGATDLGGNALIIAPGSLTFSTADDNNDVDCVFFDDLSTTNNLGSVVGAISWAGTGTVEATFAGSAFGDGSDGAVTFSTNMSINTDTNQGVFNFSSATVDPMVTLTFTGPSDDPSMATSTFPVRFLSTGTITIGTGAILDLDGRDGLPGQPNGGATPEFGGGGGPGAGAGGISSPLTTGDSLMGNPGDGPRTNGVVNPGPGTGGGGGGTGGPPGPLGPSGGGGGAASTMFPATAGESQQGTNTLGLGAPPGGVAGIALPLYVPPLMSTPGGTGGGAGGDRIDTVGIPSLADTGGAGGGGGGGLELAAAATLTLDSIAQIFARGGNGGQAVGFLVAHGGGGSGGTVIARSLTDVVVNLGVSILTSGGLGGGFSSPALNGDGGAGGDGVIQLEDSDGMFANLGLTFTLGELFTQSVSTSGNVTGAATTIVLDSGAATVKYLQTNSLGATMATLNNGTTGMADVNVVGIAEDPGNPGSPSTDPSLMVGPVGLGAIGNLDGLRFFQVTFTTTYPGPPVTTAGDVLPSIDDVQIVFSK